MPINTSKPTRENIIPQLNNESLVKIISTDHPKGIIIGFIKEKPTIKGGIIDTNIPLSLQKRALTHLSEEICDGKINQSAWHIGVIEVKEHTEY